MKTPMRKITFRADDETLRALQALEVRSPAGTTAWGRRSQILRKLILDAAAKK